MAGTLRTVSAKAQALRPIRYKDNDVAALRAIAQAALEVELFTIPLYMTTLYSIQGMHEINSKGTDFYKGRLWPGPATTAAPATANERAFNIVFSVFIQEMLHLQLASNMATVVGVTPNFSRTPLQNDENGWVCYGPDKTVIPYIIDLTDTKNNAGVVVNVGELDEDQLKLFLAIEQPEDIARKDIKEEARHKYFPKAPFDENVWVPGQPLPMFGTIGAMYQCYYDYLNVRYDDPGHTTLWDVVFNGNGQQNDLFNSFTGGGHPMREFMGFEATVALTYKDIAFQQMGQMIDAITDQGEGSIVTREPQMLAAVESKYQPSRVALESDYPTFDDSGVLVASADSVARADNDGRDHYERFGEVLRILQEGGVLTWPAWHRTNVWTAQMLEGSDYAPPSGPSNIPTPQQIAAALNHVKAGPGPSDPTDYAKLLSQAAVGAIAGVTTVLDTYWNAQAQSQSPVTFPFPSMGGTGDRLGIYWAAMGAAPDLSLGIDPPDSKTLYHACQALDLNDTTSPGTNGCAQVTVFHSCRGSNGCHAQGGCGFVQPVTGGGNCSSSSPAPAGGGGKSGCGSSGCGSEAIMGTAIGMRTFGGTCNPFSTLYSAPGDNKCGTFGGCAVPISASQLYPKDGIMTLFKFQWDAQEGKWTSVQLDENVPFRVGDNVHDIAWTAYKKVMGMPDDKPAPAATALRLVFPPST